MRAPSALECCRASKAEEAQVRNNGHEAFRTQLTVAFRIKAAALDAHIRVVEAPLVTPAKKATLVFDCWPIGWNGRPCLATHQCIGRLAAAVQLSSSGLPWPVRAVLHARLVSSASQVGEPDWPGAVAAVRTTEEDMQAQCHVWDRTAMVQPKMQQSAGKCIRQYCSGGLRTWGSPEGRDL